MENLVREIYELKSKVDAKTKQIDSLTAEIEEMNKTIEEKSKQLLNAMKASNKQELEVDDIKAGLGYVENISYTSDVAVIAWLKEHNYSQYIRTKTTESLDKTPLKKAIKTDTILAEGLESMTVKTKTEFTVVTSKENYEKRLQHINEAKSKNEKI